MKKFFKSISVLVLSLSLALSGFVFTGNVKADTESDWIQNAIKTPTEGSLVGAGYIEVKFDNSLSGYEYEVFLDDQPIYWIGNNIVKTDLGEEVTSQATRKKITSSEEGVTEVYTTQVKEHTLLVKATNGSKTITTNYRKFYVSKKGLAMGDNMGEKVSLQKLNCSWYYNWSTKAFNNSVDNGIPHIPMMWGNGDDNKAEMQNLSTNSNYILGFNEPDIDTQANFGFWEGVDTWNSYIKPLSLRKVSPAPAAPGGDSGWLYDFMNGNTICQFPDGTWDYYYDIYKDEPSLVPVDKEGVDPNDVDAVCLHYYRNTIDANGIVKAVDRLWNTYHKPVWITEIGLFGVKGTYTDMSYELSEKRTAIKNYLTTIVSSLDSKPYVERYCWFPYDVESANAIDIYDGSGATSMFEYATGLYTDLGKTYASIGNPASYSAYSISDSETFDWDNRVRTEASYDVARDYIQVSWTNGALTDLARVDITVDEVAYDVDNNGYIDASSLSEGNHAVEFTLYDNNGKEIVKKTRAVNIDRSATPTTTQAPTTTTKEPDTDPVTEPATKAPEKQTTKAQATVAPSSKTQTKPGKATLSSAKNVKKKSVKLSWKKTMGATKYKVQWALNKKFTKSKKTKIVVKTSYKVAKLKKKKTYFFRVAAMNDIGVGPWSKVKKVKIKK